MTIVRKSAMFCPLADLITESDVEQQCKLQLHERLQSEKSRYLAARGER
jgi:hypothetical protein